MSQDPTPEHALTHWSLIARAAAGNPLDRDSFVERYAPIVRVFLCARWRLPIDHEAIADATQDVFLQCFRDEGLLDRAARGAVSGFKGYLLGATRNVALMTERRLARERARGSGTEIRFDDVEASTATQSEEFDRAWARMISREARRLLASRSDHSELTIERWHILALRYEEGLATKAIAERLMIPVERVHERLKQGRKEFGACVMEVMAELHPDDNRAQLERRCGELARFL